MLWLEMRLVRGGTDVCLFKRGLCFTHIDAARYGNERLAAMLTSKQSALCFFFQCAFALQSYNHNINAIATWIARRASHKYGRDEDGYDVIFYIALVGGMRGDLNNSFLKCIVVNDLNMLIAMCWGN